MPYTGAWIVLPQKPDKFWGACPEVRFGGLGAAWKLFLSLRVPILLVGDLWFDHHTCSGDIHKDVTIPATGRHMPGSKTACNSSQQPMESAACLSSPLFSQESPHSTLPQKNQRCMSEEQLWRGQCSLHFYCHMCPNHRQRTRAETWQHEDLKSRAGPQL